MIHKSHSDYPESEFGDSEMLKFIFKNYVVCVCEMGGACGTYGGREKGAQGSGGETWGKEATGEAQTQMGG